MHLQLRLRLHAHLDLDFNKLPHNSQIIPHNHTLSNTQTTMRRRVTRDHIDCLKTLTKGFLSFCVSRAPLKRGREWQRNKPPESYVKLLASRSRRLPLAISSTAGVEHLPNTRREAGPNWPNLTPESRPDRPSLVEQSELLVNVGQIRPNVGNVRPSFRPLRCSASPETPSSQVPLKMPASVQVAASSCEPPLVQSLAPTQSELRSEPVGPLPRLSAPPRCAPCVKPPPGTMMTTGDAC